MTKAELQEKWQTDPEIYQKIGPEAKRMRKAPTPAENLLWDKLRNRQLCGCKFRRQHPIDRYIVDFYCRETKLIIEIDGEIHTTQTEEDLTRQTYLEELGYRLLRFRNQQVLNDIGEVLNTIQRLINLNRPHVLLATN